VGVAGIVPGHGRPQEVIPRARFASATSDGQTIVFQRDGLWRVDGDGGHPVQLTTDGFVPFVTPDDRHVIFLSNRSGIQSPWIVPIEGGTARQVANVSAYVLTVDVSPDSRWLVLGSRDERNQRALVICDFPVCATRRTLSTASVGGRVRWTSDGRAVAYVDGTRSNIWVQPVDERPPHQLTQFSDERTITDFAWSRDGKRLAIARATTTNDIVLFKGLKR
jgi:Tol biopolymer transport system component